MYKSKEGFSVKTMQVGLVKELLNKMANIWHLNMQHSTLVQPYFTLSMYSDVRSVVQVNVYNLHHYATVP